VYAVLFFTRDIAVVLGVGLSPFIELPMDAISARLPGKVVTNLQFVSFLALLVSSRSAFMVLAWVIGTVSVVAIMVYAFVVMERAFDQEVSRPHRIWGYGMALLLFVFVAVMLLDGYLVPAVSAVLIVGM